MGGNTSKTQIRDIINSRNINRNVLDQLNDITTNVIANNIVKNAHKTVAGSTQTATAKIGGITAVGPDSVVSGIGININQESIIQLSADDQSIQSSSIQTDYAMQLLAQIQSQVDNEQLASLTDSVSNDQTASNLAFLSGSNSTNTDIAKTINNLNLTDTQRKFVTQVATAIEQNSETLDFKDCIVNDTKSASIDIGGITAANGGQVRDINIDVNQATEIIQQCVFKTLQESDIASHIASEFGFTIEDEVANKQTAESTTTVENKQLLEGISPLMSGMSLISIIAIIIGIIVLKKAFSK